MPIVIKKQMKYKVPSVEAVPWKDCVQTPATQSRLKYDWLTEFKKKEG